MKKFKDITITIPAHVIQAMHDTQWINSEFAEFCVQLNVDEKGNLVICDYMGYWDNDKDGKQAWGRPLDQAWQMIDEWYKTLPHQKLQHEIEVLERQVADLNSELSKKKAKLAPQPTDKKGGWW